MKHQAIFDLINSEHPEDIELGFLIAKQQNISILEMNIIFGKTKSRIIKHEIAAKHTDFDTDGDHPAIEDGKRERIFQFITKWKEE